MRLVSRKRLESRASYTVLSVALLVLVLDTVTKVWARHTLASHNIHVVSDLWLRLQYNAGISFSINKSGPLVTTILTTAITVLVAVIGLRSNRGAPAVGFGLLVGGGASNLIDRLYESPHRVTDFVSFGSFPVFNLADASITIGFLILLVAMIRGERLLLR